MTHDEYHQGCGCSFCENSPERLAEHQRRFHTESEVLHGDALVVEAMDAAIAWINLAGGNTSDPKVHADLIEKLKKCAALRDEASAALTDEKDVDGASYCSYGHPTKALM